MLQKRKRSDNDTQSEGTTAIFRSERIEDRDSTFLALYSPTLKPKELQNLPEIKSASHKVLAWRQASNQQAITGATRYTTASDDDGEKYAGKKVEKVLNAMQVSGACVVARWYGGTMLGPVRFEHIENVAREAVKRYQDSVREERAKRVRLEEDERDQIRLVRVLGERDGSIEVLRKLAGEKEDAVKRLRGGERVDGELERAGTSNQDATQNGEQAKRAVDYDSLPVARLRVMERARDATLGFLLKRIDKAEAELQVLKLVDEKG